ncbi:MAG: M20/M25/M40 family metallo-hydrolase [Gemmatimonadaceae bacterium]|nr:M20/M25/M40 family metallo-hydrolase [Gemmatimonadaceae bacterium]
MRLSRTLGLLVALPFASLAAQGPIARQYGATAQRIIDAAMADSGAAWTRLAALVDYSGPRLSGSANLERGIDWVIAEMQKDGLDGVRGEPVMVPHWVRGRESLRMIAPRAADVPMLALGGSIGTPTEGITAELLVVKSFADLTARAAEAKGKIVLFDVPFTTYGATVAYRSGGAVAAARVGAVAALVRAVGPFGMRTPHTGGMAYDSTVTRLPAASVSMEDAMMFARMQARGTPVRLTLQMEAKMLPDAPSRNVIGELRGREKPAEIVVMGGHIDSWDVGPGAMDDAGGVVVAWEAIKLLKRLGLTPRRTIRVVGWTNEENGMRGGNGYKAAHQSEPHSLAIESDGGVFAPQGFGFTGSDSARVIVTQIGALLERIGAGKIGASGGGADIGPIMQTGVPGMGLEVDGTRYFWYHHTQADTPDKLDPVEMQKCVAAFAVMAYVVAELPELLPRR